MKIWKNLNQSITGLSITFLTCWSLLAKISSSILLLLNQMEPFSQWQLRQLEKGNSTHYGGIRT